MPNNREFLLLFFIFLLLFSLLSMVTERELRGADVHLFSTRADSTLPEHY